MICDARTCADCRYLEQDEKTTSLAIFLANCQHAKCKVVRLVRQQISKLQNMQHERDLTTGDMSDKVCKETPKMTRNDSEMPINVSKVSYDGVRELYGEIHEPYNDDVEGKVQQSYNEEHEAHKAVMLAKRTVETINVVETASLHPRLVFPGRTVVNRKWILRILDRFRHRAHLILVAAAVGVIVWLALVYGVFLGATACGSGRTCLASTLRYKHAKRSLF